MPSCDRGKSTRRADLQQARRYSQESPPTEIHGGLHRRRDDMKTTHEESDVILIQHVAKVDNDEVESMKVLCDDTDVFILLQLQCSLTMKSMSSGL